jgi:hypothetical protein
MKMTALIACISTGKGTWGHVNRIIQDQDWSKIILIVNEFVKDFKSEKKADIIIVNTEKTTTELAEELRKKLENKLKGEFEVALNIISGEGKEHMALLSAVLKLGLGIRLVVLTKEGIKEI